MSIINKLSKYVASGQAGLVLTSNEPEDCFTEISDWASTSTEEGNPIEVCYWDVVDGLTDIHRQPLELSNNQETDEFAALGGSVQGPVPLPALLRMVRDQARARSYQSSSGELDLDSTPPWILVVENFDRYLTPGQGQVDPTLLALIQKFIKEAQSARMFLVMQATGNFQLPPELQVHCEFIEDNIPDYEERKEILLRSLDITESEYDEKVDRAVAGLSRTKLIQYSAETLVESGCLDPGLLFHRKAAHLSNPNANGGTALDIWSPGHLQNLRCFPTPDADPVFLSDDVREITILREQSHAQNSELEKGHVRALIRWVTSEGTQDKWTEPMSSEVFENTYRPERDYHSYKNVAGVEYLKHYISQGRRKGLANRSLLSNLLLFGPGGVGKSLITKATAYELGMAMASINPAQMYGQYVGETEKATKNMIEKSKRMRCLLQFDEFQNFYPGNKHDKGGSGDLQARLQGMFLEFFQGNLNNQWVFAFGCCNSIETLPHQTKSRFDILYFGHPNRKAKDQAWDMYTKYYELDEKQKRPDDEWWVPRDIVKCCRQAETLGCSIVKAAAGLTPSYYSDKEELEALMASAEGRFTDCETGEKMVHPGKAKLKKKGGTKRPVRVVKRNANDA